jgi:hypothetical protein
MKGPGNTPGRPSFSTHSDLDSTAGASASLSRNQNPRICQHAPGVRATCRRCTSCKSSTDSSDGLRSATSKRPSSSAIGSRAGRQGRASRRCKKARRRGYMNKDQLFARLLCCESCFSPTCSASILRTPPRRQNHLTYVSWSKLASAKEGLEDGPNYHSRSRWRGNLSLARSLLLPGTERATGFPLRPLQSIQLGTHMPEASN